MQEKSARSVKLTDQLLSRVYREMATIYNQNKNKHQGSNDIIARTILWDIDWNLREGSERDPIKETETLRKLDPTDKEKVKVFARTFLDAHCKDVDVMNLYKTREYEVHRLQSMYHPYCHTDTVYVWSYTDIRTSHGHHSQATSCCDFSSCFGLFNKSSRDSSDSEGLAQLAVLVLIVAAALAALWAMYYLFQQAFNNLEQLFCNEGIVRALTKIFATVIIGGICNILLELYASPYLFSLALAANVANPVALVGFLIGAGTLVGAGLGAVVMKYVTTHVDPEALDPKHPDIFSLSARQERKLLDAGIDPIKVKCAGVAIIAEIGEQNYDNVLSRSAYASECLSLWRKIRSGELTTARIGGFEFKLASEDTPKNAALIESAPPAYDTTMFAKSSTFTQPPAYGDLPPGYVPAAPAAPGYEEKPACAM